MRAIVILGATSDIARATALAFGQAGWQPILAGRDIEAVGRVAGDLSVRLGRPVPALVFDAAQPETHRAFWENLPGPRPDALFCAVGLLGDHEATRHDPDLAQRIVTANFTGLLGVFALAADEFEQRGKGLLIGISSVAGDRGRAHNYIYGAAKAGFTAFLSGLRQRLSRSGVRVVTVKPGFVNTAMTEGKALPKALTASPQEVAKAIVAVAEKGAEVIYVKPVWRLIMLIIRHMPESIFKKMRF
ncbi:MAG: short-chain dehydrogenase [Desulfovibrionaceae bacterium CG1_02_65_16]|nr:MAG: short-chain dehydrogenase [Desulfovibrionaceae bacterium CG1_02_65_16]